MSSLEEDVPYGSWCLDDFWCESLSRSGSIVTLRGIPYWLDGGEDSVEFQVDVALETDPLLYSYKFTTAQWRKTPSRQVLYVGKTPDGWILNNA